MSKWISVKDRLPDLEDWYLVYGDGGNGTLVRPYDSYHKCWNDEENDDYECDAQFGWITHWMPLPEPPEK